MSYEQLLADCAWSLPNAEPGEDGVLYRGPATQIGRMADARIAALEAEVARLRAAIERQVANIDHWLATGKPADSTESKSIYEQLCAALKKDGQ